MRRKIKNLDSFEVSVCRQSLQTGQSERNEDIFRAGSPKINDFWGVKKRASAYDCTIDELFVKALENTIKINIPYIKGIELQI